MGSLSALTQIAALNCKQMFLGLRPWNYYLNADPNNNCQIQNFTVFGSHSSIFLILLAIIDDLFRLLGILAVLFVMYAGLKFILSQGSPDEAAKARTTAINALVGIGIAMVAITFTSFLGTQVGNERGTIFGHLNLNSLPFAEGADGPGLIHTGLNVAFGILGAIAFLVIVIAGLQYVLSQGDAQTTARAKSTIVYAIVGLLLAIVAQSIVSFAISTHP